MSILRVVSVHGVSTDIIPIKKDYALALEQKLVQELTKLKVIPAHANQSQIDQIITFDQVNYSDIGAPQRKKIYDSYRADAARLENFLDKALDALVIDQLRKQLIGAGGNVLVYQSTYWKEAIRQRVVEKITPFIPTSGSISLIGHSLGSVVGFDVAYYNPVNNPNWTCQNFYLSNLFTIGSPIAIFTLDLQDTDGQPKTRYTNPPDMKLVRDDGVWYNFFDAQDLIGYPLETLYPNQVKDFLVQTGTLPQTAHIGYWSNDEVAANIAARLKLDYERVTGQKIQS